MANAKLVKVGEQWMLELPESAARALGGEEGAEVLVELSEAGISARDPDYARARVLAAGAQSMEENRGVFKKLSNR